MARSSFWLSDEAWKTLEPHLPHGKPGKPRVDDRTVISGVLHVLKTGCRWRDVQPMGHRRPSTTATIVGPSAVSGSAFSRKWRPPVQFLTSFPSTAAMSRRPAGPVPDELSIDSSHVKAHRSAAGSKRGSSRKRLAVRAAEKRAKSTLWPMIAADRSRLH